MTLKVEGKLIHLFFIKKNKKETKEKAREHRSRERQTVREKTRETFCEPIYFRSLFLGSFCKLIAQILFDILHECFTISSLFWNLFFSKILEFFVARFFLNSPDLRSLFWLTFSKNCKGMRKRIDLEECCGHERVFTVMSGYC